MSVPDMTCTKDFILRCILITFALSQLVAHFQYYDIRSPKDI